MEGVPLMMIIDRGNLTIEVLTIKNFGRLFTSGIKNTSGSCNLKVYRLFTSKQAGLFDRLLCYKIKGELGRLCLHSPALRPRLVVVFTVVVTAVAIVVVGRSPMRRMRLLFLIRGAD